MTTRVNVATATASAVNHDDDHHHWRGRRLLLPSSYPWHKKRARTNNVVRAQVEFFFNVLCYCIELTYFLDLGFIYGTTTPPRQNHDEGRHRHHTGTQRTPSTTAASTARGVGTGTATVDQTEREGNHDATGRRKRDDGRRGGGGKPNGKKARETSATSLGPLVSFFFCSFVISFSFY